MVSRIHGAAGGARARRGQNGRRDCPRNTPRRGVHGSDEDHDGGARRGTCWEATLGLRALGAAVRHGFTGDMTALELNHLMRLERDGWDALCRSQGADFYGRLMTEDGVMVLVNGAILDRDAVQASLKAAPAWDGYEITGERLIPVGSEGATLVYRATAQRDGDEPFEAVMSSTYALIDATPRLTVHQQTTTTH